MATESLYVAHVAEDGGVLIATDLRSLAGPWGRAIATDLLRRATSLAAGNHEDWTCLGDGHLTIAAPGDAPNLHGV